MVGEYLVYHRRARVGDNHFLDKPPGDLRQSVDGVLVDELPLAQKLGQEVRGPLDRAGDELGEERHVRGEGDKVLRWFHRPAVHVYRVAHCLKGIEADPDRKDNPKSSELDRFSEEGEDRLYVIDEEIVVFEETKEPKVADDAYGEKELSFALIVRFIKPYTHEVIDEGANEQKRKESIVPPSVEHVAHNKEECVLYLQVSVKNEPIEKKDDWDE